MSAQLSASASSNLREGNGDDDDDDDEGKKCIFMCVCNWRALFAACGCVDGVYWGHWGSKS